MNTNSFDRTEVGGNERFAELRIAACMANRWVKNQDFSGPHGDLDFVLRKTKIPNDLVKPILGKACGTDKDDGSEVEVGVHVKRRPVIFTDGDGGPTTMRRNTVSL